jgi:hypothetical protein
LIFAPVSAAPVTILTESKSPGLTAVVVKFEQRVAAVIVQVVLVAEPFIIKVAATETVVALDVAIIPAMVRAFWKGIPVPRVAVCPAQVVAVMFGPLP